MREDGSCKVIDLPHFMKGLAVSGTYLDLLEEATGAPNRSTGAPNGPEHRIFAAILERTQLVDSFRHLHPTLEAWTYHSTRDTFSRIDHILVD